MKVLEGVPLITFGGHSGSGYELFTKGVMYSFLEGRKSISQKATKSETKRDLLRKGRRPSCLEAFGVSVTHE